MSDLFPTAIPEWILRNADEPTLLDIYDMEDRGTRERPPKRPDWWEEYWDRVSTISGAVEDLRSYGYEVNIELPLMTRDQQRDYDEYLILRREWESRHPNRSTGKTMQWGYSSPGTE